VTSSQIVAPTQVDVMNPTGVPTLTLISCYPYMVDKSRIVVFAKLQNP
jgi:sortase A